MISKLCSWGETRAQAIYYMQEALDNYQIEGIGQNIPFLQVFIGILIFAKAIFQQLL